MHHQNGNGVLKKLKSFEISDDINNAKVAQLVEHNLAKVGVASSNLVFRSEKLRTYGAFFVLKHLLFARVTGPVDSFLLDRNAVYIRKGSDYRFYNKTLLKKINNR